MTHSKARHFLLALLITLALLVLWLSRPQEQGKHTPDENILVPLLAGGNIGISSSYVDKKTGMTVSIWVTHIMIESIQVIESSLMVFSCT